MGQIQQKKPLVLITTALSMLIFGLGANSSYSLEKSIGKYYPLLGAAPLTTEPNLNNKDRRDLLILGLGIILVSIVINYIINKIPWNNKPTKENSGLSIYPPLFDDISDGVILLDKHESVEYANEKAQILLCCSWDEVKGKDIKSLIPNFSREKIKLTITSKDGGILEILPRYFKEVFKEEKIFILIQEEKNTINFRNTIGSLNRLGDSVGALIFALDLEGNIMSLNSVAQKVSDYSFEEVFNQKFGEIFLSSEKREDYYNNIFRRLRAGEYPIYCQSYFFAKNKKLIFIDWTNTILFNEKNEAEYIIVAGLDISRRLAIEESLQVLHQDLDHLILERTNSLEQINQELQIEISQRQTIEEALQREVYLLGRIMETSPVAIVVLENHGNILLASAQAEKVLGLTKNKNLKKTLERLTDYEGNYIPPEELPLQQVLSTGKPIYNSENSIEWSDGERLFLSINGAPLFNQQGKIEAVVLTLEDTTKRVKADMLKEELITRSQALIDALGEIVYEYDITSNTVYWEGNYGGVLGYAREEMGNNRQDWLTKVYPDDQEIIEEELAQALAENRIFDTEYRLRCKDGSYRWIHDRALINPGSYGRMTGVILDIAERKNAEAALKDSEEKFRGLVENIHQVFWISSSNPREILYVSPAYEQIWGRTCESLYANPIIWLDSIHPEDRERISQALDKIIFEGELVETYRIVRPDNSVRWVSVRSSAIANSAGETIRHIGIAEDITYQIESEKALQEANQKLTQWVNELEQRNQDMAYLEQMNDFLQSCMRVEEAYSVIGDLIKPMFSGSSGGVFIIDEKNTLVEAIATWGDCVNSETIFTVDQCWALRQGHIHSIEYAQPNLFCQHISQNPPPARTLCVPMMAQGKAVGLLYLCFPEPTKLSQERENLARTVSEQLSLALANLQLRETLHQQSIRDPLTGLYNRRHMEASLDREIHKALRKKYPLSIVMVDIDHFKRFNDGFGHDVGDAVLREVSDILFHHTRGGDIACRYGGEELILILPEATLADSYKRAQQLRHLIRSIDLEHEGKSLGTITASFGIACFPDQGNTAQEIIKAADQALYRAKAEGRDRIIVAQKN
jgi:diguanylate cyclase (GGDEF)-like protein/PAS domain S-box-containing protein